MRCEEDVGAKNVQEDLRHRAILKKFASYNLPKVQVISPRGLVQKMSQAREKVVLVDTRSDPEIAVSRLPGAISSVEFERIVSAGELSPDTIECICCYCTLGVRSAKFVARLASERPELAHCIYNLPGSILRWVWEGGTDGEEYGRLEDSNGEVTRTVHVFGSAWDLLPDGYKSITFGHSGAGNGWRCRVS
jgi:rhodanese-related sulfurtransferase